MERAISNIIQMMIAHIENRPTMIPQVITRGSFMSNELSSILKHLPNDSHNDLNDCPSDYRDEPKENYSHPREQVELAIFIKRFIIHYVCSS